MFHSHWHISHQNLIFFICFESFMFGWNEQCMIIVFVLIISIIWNNAHQASAFPHNILHKILNFWWFKIFKVHLLLWYTQRAYKRRGRWIEHPWFQNRLHNYWLAGVMIPFTHLFPFSKSNFKPIMSIKSDHVNLVALASPVDCLLY